MTLAQIELRNTEESRVLIDGADRGCFRPTRAILGDWMCRSAAA